MATTMNPAIDYHELIHEDRIHGRLYRDPDIFEEEFTKIWYRSWVYVGHESEVPEPGDYRTKQIGRQPVIMVRDENGSVNLLLNRCAHRGNIVCQNERGNAHVFRCAYHGWTYSNRGDLLGATFVGAYGDSFDKSDYRLAQVPRVDSYRGLIFASMSPTGPTLAEHLGRVTEYLDAFIDFSPDGELEVRSGVQKAKYHGNWKMMAENSLEGNYHGHFIHQFIFSLNRQRQGGSLDTNNLNNEESPDKVVYLPGGHMVEDLAVSPMPMVEQGRRGLEPVRRGSRVEVRHGTNRLHDEVRGTPHFHLPQPHHDSVPDSCVAARHLHRDECVVLSDAAQGRPPRGQHAASSWPRAELRPRRLRLRRRP